jgi:hypothetical protein
MIHPWIFGGSVLAGGGLVAFALNTPFDASRLPSLEPSPQAVNVVPPTPPPVVVEPASSVLEMPEVVLEGHAARRLKAPPAAPAAEPLSLRPCSSWRELGPTHVVSGATSDTVSVRALCQ